VVDKEDAINAIKIMLTQPIFISEGEIQTITGYYAEDFEESLQDLRDGKELRRKDYILIWQALAVFGAFSVDREVMTDAFGEDYDAAIDTMMRKIGAHLGFNHDQSTM